MAPGRGLTVGVIGLGNLGMPMARALLDGGWSVVAYDQSVELAREAERYGAVAATDLGCLTGSDVIAVVVPNDSAVEDVLEGSHLLDGLSNDTVVVVHSTVLPSTARRLHDRATLAGVRYLDAPVSGGADRARNGALTVMVGATGEVLDHAETYLHAIAATVVRTGPVGSGSAAKLGNQLMMFSALAATYEAIELGEVHGLTATKLFEAVATSTGDCWVAREWGFFDKTASAYDHAGVPVRNRPWSKDLWDIVAAARAADLHLPVAGLLAQHMPERVENHAAHSRERSS